MIGQFSAFWRNIFRRRRLESELDEEIRGYVQLLAAEKMHRGVAAGEALRQARCEVGIERVKENVRDIRIGVSMDTLMQDLRYALRTLTRNPGFYAVAILTLALGIGANTVIFTVVNGVLLKPLPYPEPDRLFMLWESDLHGGPPGSVAPANFVDWRQQNQSFAKMAAIDAYPDYILSGAGEPRRLTGAAVTADFFSLFQVRMRLGRDFLPEEDTAGRSHVALLSYDTWQHYFGGRPDIIGAAIDLNNASYTVVGVLPSDFLFVGRAVDFGMRPKFDIWTPMGLPTPLEAWQRHTHPLAVFARLNPGVALPQAQADLNRIAASLRQLYPEANKTSGILAEPLASHVVGDVRRALFTLLGAVGMVLLIACANIANLLLTRAAARRKEIAVRIALGAGRSRIARQLATESLVLTAAGGLLALLLVIFSVPALVRHLPADLPRTAEIAVDGRVLAFTTVLCILTGLLFGLVPVLQTRLVAAADSLKQGGRAIAGAQSRMRSALIVAQVATALILLTGAGLMAKSFWKLVRISPGFRVEHLLTARISLPPHYTNANTFGTGKHPRIAAFERDFAERARAIPGVLSVAFTSYLPLAGTNNFWAFTIEGRPAKPVGVYDLAQYRPVSAGYFDTIGIPIARGRAFDLRDRDDAPPVVMINVSMARVFWKGENPVGQRLRFGDNIWRTIVGVVGDVRHKGLAEQPAPEIYLPYGQAPNVEARPTIVLRTAVEPEQVGNALRHALAAVDAGVPMDQIETMTQIVSASVSQSRFRTALLVTFAFLALFVASIGLYGVMSYLVSQRTREFGIRMALGASRGAVLRLVLGEATKMVGLGIGLGLLGSALLARFIAGLLYGVGPFDAVTLAGVSMLLAAVALAASYLPAHRGARADPMDSLRYE
jgi:putative ABC transport system permease protein